MQSSLCKHAKSKALMEFDAGKILNIGWTVHEEELVQTIQR